MLHSEWSRAKIESLQPATAGTNVEALLITLEPGGASGSRQHVNDHDLLAIVFDGALLLKLNESVHSLAKGDAVMIPTGTAH